MANKFKIEGIVANFKEDAWMLFSLLQEKGVGFFKVPLLVGLGALFFSYSVIYKPLGSTRKSKTRLIASLNTQSKYASDFLQKKQAVEALSQKLPNIDKKNEFLTNTIELVCKQTGIIPDSTSPASEADEAGVTTVTQSFTINAPFKSAAELLTRLENQEHLVALTSVNIRRSEVVGNVVMDIVVMTVFPKT
ncbi:MAG: hypothetical protein WCS77_09735 [Elusimicrobiaceae bacterium]|jgi:hypothetical protein